MTIFHKDLLKSVYIVLNKTKNHFLPPFSDETIQNIPLAWFALYFVLNLGETCVEVFWALYWLALKCKAKTDICQWF